MNDVSSEDPPNVMQPSSGTTGFVGGHTRGESMDQLSHI
jgi:hypothetical protein